MEQEAMGGDHGGQVAGGHRNEVWLVGQLSAGAEERALPSGDAVALFRLTVRRAADEGIERPHRSRSPDIDTLQCAAWRADIRRAVLSWPAGAVVEVRGALRRRFWRAPSGPASRYEVDVAAARRLDAACQQDAAPD
ncbi:MAG: single-stranded DNA-binding protein [Streptomycetales bacterium]